MNAVQDGTINTTHSDIPSFLYGAGTEYKEENQSNGPLQGYFLVRVSQYLHFGPMIIICSIGLATHLYRPGITLDGGIGARCRPIFVYIRSNFIVNQGKDGLQTSTSMKTSTTRHEPF